MPRTTEVSIRLMDAPEVQRLAESFAMAFEALDCIAKHDTPGSYGHNIAEGALKRLKRKGWRRDAVRQ